MNVKRRPPFVPPLFRAAYVFVKRLRCPVTSSKDQVVHILLAYSGGGRYIDPGTSASIAHQAESARNLSR
jgi:hypothetical protein